MFYVYVLKSEQNGSLYVGSTNDLRRRFKEHNEGKSGYTRKYRPYKLVYYEAYKSESDARTRENNLKLRRNAFTHLKRRIVESIKAN